MNVKNAFKKYPFLRIAKESLQYTFPYAFKPSKEFYKWKSFIDESQWWSKDQLEEYQRVKIKEMLNYCYQFIPYYQKLFKKIDISPEDFKIGDGFEKIPFLTKELLRVNTEELLPLSIDKNKIIKYNTGGSTGIPLPIYKTGSDNLIEEAFMTSQWERIGFRPKDSRVIIRGEVINDNKLWKYHPSSNSWFFSSYHLSNVFIKKMVNKLNKIKPQFLHVYPSSLWVFANLIKENDLKLNFTPKAILCGSEKLFDHQRKLFTEVFGCRSYSWLGLAEQTILAGECEYSSDLHIFPQHSYIELIDDSGAVINDPGITGHIAGTNLHKYSFPLIRYLSGDTAQYAEGTCKCGRHFRRFIQVDGRIQHVIVSNDGRIIPLTALIFGQHLQAFNKIEKMQLVQRKQGEVEVKLIKGKNFTSEDKETLINQLTFATKRSVQFFITYHSELERTVSGKHKFLIQYLDINFYKFNQD